MATFIGTAGPDIIAPGFISAGVRVIPPGSNLDGDDSISSGRGNDLVVGGLGNDVADLGNGRDLFGWEPGDGDDTVDGGFGFDTLVFNGSDGNELMTVTTQGGGFQFFRDLGDIQVDTVNVERIVTDARGGDDVFDASAQTDPDVRILVNGNDGDDQLIGGAGNDTFAGGAGDDLIVGGRGNDVASMGSGRDIFVWEPGDGDDTVDGGGQGDTLVFNGSDGNELLTVTTQGGGFQFFRDLGDIQVDTTSVERVRTDARGGDDRFDGSAQTDPIVRLFVDGGEGNDTLIGGAGRDVLDGGAGDDTLDGGGLADRLTGDEGGDVFAFGIGGRDQYPDSTRIGPNAITDYTDGVDSFLIDTSATGADDFANDVTVAQAGAHVRLTIASNAGVVQAVALLLTEQAGNIDAGDFTFVA